MERIRRCRIICEVVLLLFTANRVHSFLLHGPVVPCPNPAQHCLHDLFNRVVENQGCLGCQMGCQPGYVMTANPRYYIDTDKPRGHYFYWDIPIENTVNISQPQWICLKGNECRGGFFASKMGDVRTCSWCGRGCSMCTSFHNCLRCFSGFSLNSHTLAGGQQVVTCSHSDVPCPSPPDHCLHDAYMSLGIGCAGCQLCEDGYVVTFNPKYMNTSVSAANSGMFDYMGLQTHHGVNVNEPRSECVAGDTCQDGWYGTDISGTLFCAECSRGCAHCSSRTNCAACKVGYTLVQGTAANSTACSPTS